jgi:hypothetical protein
MTRHILYAVLCLGSVSFIAWRVYAVRNRETPHFEIVKDPSASHGGGCASLVGLTGQVLEADAAGPGSTVTVLVLGDQSTAGEPWRMGSYAVPSVRKVLEGRSAKLRQQERILQDVSGKCQALRRTAISPIFLGVTQAVADLHARGCKPTSHCELFVDTDLEENVEPAIRKALLKNEGAKHVPLSPVDNSGIGIVFCGVAVTDGRIHDRVESGTRRFLTRDSGELYRMQEVWRSLFAEPAGVRFEPYCPNSTDTRTQPMPRARANEVPQL